MGRAFRSHSLESPEIPPHAVSQNSPKLIGDYVKLTVIAEGDFCKVFACRHCTDRLPYALKRIDLRKLSRSMLGISQLRTELDILRRLPHRNIVSLREVLYVASSQIVYTVAEFADAGTLESARPFLTPIQLRYIVKEIANGIAHLHSMQIVHQDIKPANILLSKSGRVVITDFGMSHSFSTPAVVFGTPLYLAPETIDATLDVVGCEGKVDVWALGITLYEMIFGVTPYQGYDVYEITAAIRDVPLARPGVCDPDAWALIEGMLTVDPVKRFSIGDVVNWRFIGVTPEAIDFENCPGIEVPEMPELSGLAEEQAVVCGPDFKFQYVQDNGPDFFHRQCKAK
jgi:serine/threonine protein kinase